MESKTEPDGLAPSTDASTPPSSRARYGLSSALSGADTEPEGDPSSAKTNSVGPDDTAHLDAESGAETGDPPEEGYTLRVYLANGNVFEHDGLQTAHKVRAWASAITTDGYYLHDEQNDVTEFFPPRRIAKVKVSPMLDTMYSDVQITGT